MRILGDSLLDLLFLFLSSKRSLFDVIEEGDLAHRTFPSSRCLALVAPAILEAAIVVI